MNTVYSTTISPLPYPNVLIVDAEPALAVNDPERLVVIPTFAFTPVNAEPSPLNYVAVIIPVTTTPEFVVSILLVLPPYISVIKLELTFLQRTPN